MPVYRRTYLCFRASYAPGAGGVWKKGHPGCRVRKFSILTKNSFFGKHLKKCVAIAYLPLPVNRKHEKRREFFRMYLYSGARYAPKNSGVWKKGHPGCRVRKFKLKNSLFGKHLKPSPNRHRFAAPTIQFFYILWILVYSCFFTFAYVPYCVYNSFYSHWLLCIHLYIY